MSERHSSGEQRPEGGGIDAGGEPAHNLGENLGRSLGKLARSARAAARSAQPEAERLAHHARDAAEAALPHVKRATRGAANRAGQFVRENNDEIRRATTTGAGIAASRSGPILRPVIFAVADEITRQTANLARQAEPERPGVTPDQESTKPASDTPRKDVNLF